MNKWVVIGVIVGILIGLAIGLIINFAEDVGDSEDICDDLLEEECNVNENCNALYGRVPCPNGFFCSSDMSFVGCVSVDETVSGGSGDPLQWVIDLIVEEESGSVASPPASLSKCDYNGQIVYYLPPRCCDIGSVLYDESGEVICSPDGGIADDGDGRCTDFNQDICEVIWQDSRT